MCTDAPLMHFAFISENCCSLSNALGKISTQMINQHLRSYSFRFKFKGIKQNSMTRWPRGCVHSYSEEDVTFQRQQHRYESDNFFRSILSSETINSETIVAKEKKVGFKRQKRKIL